MKKYFIALTLSIILMGCNNANTTLDLKYRILSSDVIESDAYIKCDNDYLDYNSAVEAKENLKFVFALEKKSKEKLLDIYIINNDNKYSLMCLFSE